MPKSSSPVPEMSVDPPTIKLASTRKQKSDSNMPVVVTLIVCMSVAIVVVGAVLYWTVGQDTWADDMRYEVPRRVEQAASFAPEEAAAEYAAILTESEGHEITNTAVADALETARAKLQEVNTILAEMERVRKERARLKAEEEAALATAERRRQEEEAQQQKVAEQIKSLAQHYVAAPQDARDVVALLTRLAAQTEAGISYIDYSDELRNTLADFRVYELSSTASRYEAITYFCGKALTCFEKAGDVWREGIKGTSTADYKTELQKNWFIAAMYVELSKHLLDPGEAEETLTTYFLETTPKEATPTSSRP